MHRASCRDHRGQHAPAVRIGTLVLLLSALALVVSTVFTMHNSFVQSFAIVIVLDICTAIEFVVTHAHYCVLALSYI